MVPLDIDDDVGALLQLAIHQHPDDELQISQGFAASSDEQSGIFAFDLEHDRAVPQVIQNVRFNIDIHRGDQVAQDLTGRRLQLFTVLDRLCDGFLASAARLIDSGLCFRRLGLAIRLSGTCLSGLLPILSWTLVVGSALTSLPVLGWLAVTSRSRTFVARLLVFSTILTVRSITSSAGRAFSSLTIAVLARLTSSRSGFGISNARCLVHLGLPFSRLHRLLGNHIREFSDLDFC